MHIQSTDKIEGVPLLQVRGLFRKAGAYGDLTVDFVRRHLRLTKAKSDRFITALVEIGLVAPIRGGGGGRSEGDLQLTAKGVRLRAATAAKPLRRQTATRLLSGLLERIAVLNSDNYFLAEVKRAVVFGSYIGNADRISDVDVAVELVPRERDVEKHLAANLRRVSEEGGRGRFFGNISHEAYWWHQEAMLFLRNRSRGLSLQGYREIQSIVDQCPHEVVFDSAADRSLQASGLQRISE